MTKLMTDLLPRSHSRFLQEIMLIVLRPQHPKYSKEKKPKSVVSSVVDAALGREELSADQEKLETARNATVEIAEL